MERLFQCQLQRYRIERLLPPDRMIAFLVADNDRRVRVRLRSIIRRESETWYVRTTLNGQDALRSLRNARFDIAILNTALPDLDGLEILRAVQRESINTDVVFLSETDCLTKAVRAMKAGARDFLVKPVTKDDLMHAIHELLERRFLFRREIVNRMDEYLKDHFSDASLRRTDLCRHFNFSSAYVSRQFRDRLGTSFRNRLRYYRIEKAKFMLRFTGDRMYVIAAQCGFKNQSRFSEAFRRHEGLTPGQFRKDWIGKR